MIKKLPLRWKNLSMTKKLIAFVITLLIVISFIMIIKDPITQPNTTVPFNGNCGINPHAPPCNVPE